MLTSGAPGSAGAGSGYPATSSRSAFSAAVSCSGTRRGGSAIAACSAQPRRCRVTASRHAPYRSTTPAVLVTSIIGGSGSGVSSVACWRKWPQAPYRCLAAFGWASR
jgi:hypothetical protein